MPQGFATHGKLPFVLSPDRLELKFLQHFETLPRTSLVPVLVLYTRSPPWLTRCIMDSQHLRLFFGMPSAFVACVQRWVRVISKLTSDALLWCSMPFLYFSRNFCYLLLILYTQILHVPSIQWRWLLRWVIDEWIYLLSLFTESVFDLRHWKRERKYSPEWIM